MATTTLPALEWAQKSACVHALADARVVHVRGDDARPWLNGQTTNDIREVGEDAAVYALSVNVKGRIQADLWVIAEGDEGLAFVAPASATEALLEALDRYIIMEDVELEADPSLAVVTVQGPLSARVLEQVSGDQRRYATQRLGAGGMDLWVPVEELDDTLAALTQAAAALGGGQADDEAWETAHVLSGVPMYGRDFGDKTYPQEAGLKGRAVSFNKGCYLGQEVICMLENRGKLARRLGILEAVDEARAEVGDACNSPDGARVGQVTSVASLQPGWALAMLKRGHDEPGTTVRIGNGTWNVTAVVGGGD